MLCASLTAIIDGKTDDDFYQSAHVLNANELLQVKGGNTGTTGTCSKEEYSSCDIPGQSSCTKMEVGVCSGTTGYCAAEQRQMACYCESKIEWVLGCTW